MNNGSNNYFTVIIEMAEILDNAARYCHNALVSFNMDNLPKIREDLHRACTASSEKKKSTKEKLYKDFITPLEREDIMDVINSIERATCGLEEAFSQIYIYNVSKIKENAAEFFDLAARVSSRVKKLSLGFEKFRKTPNLYKKAGDIAEISRESEKMYVEALRKLVGEASNSSEIFVWSEIYKGLKESCLLCGLAAETLGMAILKNV